MRRFSLHHSLRSRAIKLDCLGVIIIRSFFTTSLQLCAGIRPQQSKPCTSPWAQTGLDFPPNAWNHPCKATHESCTNMPLHLTPALLILIAFSILTCRCSPYVISTSAVLLVVHDNPFLTPISPLSYFTLLFTSHRVNHHPSTICLVLLNPSLLRKMTKDK